MDNDSQLELNLDRSENDENAEKLAQERKDFLNKVLSCNLETSIERVGFILNNYGDTRNSDVELAWTYWKIFESEIFNGEYLTKSQLFLLPKINTLTRCRARIQNEYRLFEADDEVKKYRGVLEEDMKNEAIEQKPSGLPHFSIYIDEAGKTQQYISVGSLWVIDGPSTFTATNQLREWKKNKNIDYEFHFKDITDNKMENYKQFFLTFLQLNPTIGFKVIIINKKGIPDVGSAITDLTFHLINKGIYHENVTGRAPLPRYLQAWIDEEEKGYDQLKIENLKERISRQHIEGLYLGDILAVDSRFNFYIQAVDLFTSAISRKIHNPINQKKAKDDLADYILNLLHFDHNQLNLNNNIIDKSTVFNLNYVPLL